MINQCLVLIYLSRITECLGRSSRLDGADGGLHCRVIIVFSDYERAIKLFFFAPLLSVTGVGEAFAPFEQPLSGSSHTSQSV